MQPPLLSPSELPDSIPEAIFALAALASDRMVMQIKEGEDYRCLTYGDMLNQVQRLAAGLIELGVQGGHRVAIVAENRPEWVVAYLSILTAGATAVPLDMQMPPDQLTPLLISSHSRFLFASRTTLPLLHTIPSSIQVVSMDGPTGPHQLAMKDLITRTQLKPREDIVRHPENVASLLYSSGTTQRPKGVLLSHRNFMANAKAIMDERLAGPDDNFLVMLPLHHAYPFMIAFLVPILLGARMTFLQSLKGPELVQCMHETGITMVVGVPQIFTMIRRSIFQEVARRPQLNQRLFRLMMWLSYLAVTHTPWNPGRVLFAPLHRRFGPSLRLLCSGGAKLDPQVSKDLSSLGFTIREGYGLTETAPVIAFSPLTRPKPGSVGRPVANVEVRIDQPNEAGIGEVIVRGPNVMKEYDQAPTETAEALQDGWFHTGDLGYLDSEGYLFLTGRKKELIVTPGGKNILPEELEARYHQSPAITELCILGLSHEGEDGERLHAVVVPAFDYIREHKIHDSAGYIKDQINGISITLPPYKRVSGITFTKDPLPRTRLGKIQRHLVLARIRTENTSIGKSPDHISEADEQLRQSDTAQAVLNILRGLVSSGRDIRMDDHLDLDLGFDSLKRVELQASLESRWGAVPETFMGEIVTVRDVIEKLMTRKRDLSATTESHQSWQEIFAAPVPSELTNTYLLPPSRRHRLIGHVAMSVLEHLLRLGFKLNIQGLGNLPKDGPCILAANHLSFIDPFIILATVPRPTFTHLHTLGWEPYFRSRAGQWVARVGHVIPVGPETPLVTVLRISAVLLRNGKSLLIFPEGERSIDGQLLPFKKGVGVLAYELQIPVIPIKIEGSFQAWPPDAKRPHNHPITLTFGKGQTFTHATIMETHAAKGEDPHVVATNLIREAIASL